MQTFLLFDKPISQQIKLLSGQAVVWTEASRRRHVDEIKREIALFRYIKVWGPLELPQINDFVPKARFGSLSRSIGSLTFHNFVIVYFIYILEDFDHVPMVLIRKI